MTWYSTDPRFAIYKRASIILFYMPLSIVGKANVETKNGWSIITDMEKFRTIGDGDDWPDDLCWTYAPNASSLEEKILDMYKGKNT